MSVDLQVNPAVCHAINDIKKQLLRAALRDSTAGKKLPCVGSCWSAVNEVLEPVRRPATELVKTDVDDLRKTDDNRGDQEFGERGGSTAR